MLRLGGAGFKVVVAAALRFLLVHIERLDPSAVVVAGRHWPLLIVVAPLIYLQLAITAWRWQFLLRLQALSIGFGDAFSLTMIGSLFNVVIPGSVGGDVVKAFYVAERIDVRKRGGLVEYAEVLVVGHGSAESMRVAGRVGPHHILIDLTRGAIRSRVKPETEVQCVE